MDNIKIDTTLANEPSGALGTFSSIFTNSTLIYLLIFLAIYVGVYFVLGIFYGGSAESGPLRIVRIIDILVLLFVIIYVATTYWNTNVQTFSSNLSGSLSSFKGFADNPYSIFTVLAFLLAFYLAIYAVQIPMSSIAKPISIMFVETVAILLFVALLIIDFFKYLLNIDLLDLILDYFIKKLNTPAPTESKDPSSSEAPNGTVPQCKPATTPPEVGEVFNIRNNLYKYDEAKQVCSLYGAKLATYDQIEKAYNDGAEWCNYGWSEGQMALFPTQKSTWDKMQNKDSSCGAKANNACGRPGINGGIIKNPNIRFGVNCYGKKPPPTAAEKKLMDANVDVKIPETAADREIAAKLKVWQKNSDKFLLVNSFNKNQWSE